MLLAKKFASKSIAMLRVKIPNFASVIPFIFLNHSRGRYCFALLLV